MPRPSKIAQLSFGQGSDCDERVVHMDAVRGARRALLPAEQLAQLSALFGAFSDPTRLRIIAALSAQELCVCDLAAAIAQSESAVSHQLRQLRELRLVRSRREGRRVYYSLDDDHVLSIYAQACEHVRHDHLIDA